MNTEDRLLIIATFALFIIVIAVITLTSPARKVPDLEMTVPAILNMSDNNSRSLNTSSLAFLNDDNPYYGSDMGSAQAVPLNCTPLGDVQKLIMLQPKYIMYYGDQLTYAQYSFKGVSAGNFMVQNEMIMSYSGQRVEATVLSAYGLDGKCVQSQMTVRGYEDYFKGANSILKCSGYPMWIVCSEMLNDSYFVGNETVEIRGKKYAVRVYKSGDNQLWVGYDPPILYKYLFVNQITNKSFSAELLDVKGGLG